MSKSILSDKRLNLRDGKNTVIHTLLKSKIRRNKIMGYFTFIKSEEWQMIRVAWFKKYGKKCLKCNSYKNIHLHHIVYPKLNEFNVGTYRKVQDKHFVGLCASCHKKYHEIYGVHQDMISTTIEYVGKAKHNKLFSQEKRKKVKKKKAKKYDKRKKYTKTTKVRKSLSASDLLSL
jgi:hypothetical protein